MKKHSLMMLFVCLSIIATVGCAGGEKKQDAPTDVTKEEYQCPMKCTEELFDKPDTCKVCGMDLEKITKG